MLHTIKRYATFTFFAIALTLCSPALGAGYVVVAILAVYTIRLVRHLRLKPYTPYMLEK